MSLATVSAVRCELYRGSRKKLEKLRDQLQEQRYVILSLQLRYPDLSYYSTSAAYITFSSIAAKLAFCQEYFYSLQKYDVPDKFRLNGVKVDFVEAPDPRDMNYRYPPDSRRTAKYVALFYVVWLVGLVLSGCLYLVSLIFRLPAAAQCQDSTRLTSEGVTECNCATNSLSTSLAE